MAAASGQAGAAPSAAGHRVSAPAKHAAVVPPGGAQFAMWLPLSPADLAALEADGAATPSLPTVVASNLPQLGADYAPASSLAASGIPVTALAAYEQAAAREGILNPACGLTWPLLAGIGRVESDHGRFAGAVLHSDGVSTPRIIGIPLNGRGTALIRDTDHGRLDGDTVYDHAVGPMQFIPSTWTGWGVDANHDGVKDPYNVFDAAAAAADYLCAAGRDLSTTHGQVQAILSYNYSYDYVSLVMGVERAYASGVGITVPVLPTSPEPLSGPPKSKPPLPPVDPGKPGGAPSPGPGGGSGASSGSSGHPSGSPSSSGSSSSGSSSSGSSSSGSSSSGSSSSGSPTPPPSSTSGSTTSDPPPSSPTPSASCPSSTGSSSSGSPSSGSPSGTDCPSPGDTAASSGASAATNNDLSSSGASSSSGP
ncbi:MAG TPA: lytic murein transglycosylase [Jatrophihabitans sp.]|nr:lytic murein transglycosylase [Jatrophihabitans sp.]